MTLDSGSGSRPLRGLASIGRGQPLLARSAATARVRAAPAASGESLPWALATCLDLLESDPPGFRRAATAWHARWCARRPTLTLADALVTRAALEAMTGPDPVAGARDLSRQASHHGERALAEILDRWIAGRQAAARRYDTEQLTTVSQVRR